MKALKKLGQNFLINKSALRKIADSLELKEGENILEIGPGTGNLTEFILEYPANYFAVEKDLRLKESLEKMVSNRGKIIFGDIRDLLLPTSEKLKKYKLCGNIPYYITGRLFRILGEMKNPPTSAVFTIQKEVALRIVGENGKENRLSSLIKLWATPRIILRLKPGDFRPRPKVSSAVLKLDIFSFENRLKNEKEISELIVLGFSAPRKTLLSNLTKKFDREKLKSVWQELEWNEKIRPENLTRELWIKLNKTLYS